MASSHQFVADWSASKFIDWANGIDSIVAELIIKIIDSKNHPEQAYKSCMGIIFREKGQQIQIN